MRKIDESSFNASLSKKIKQLSEAITQLTPENFDAISERYLELNRKIEARNWMFDDKIMVNSVDAYKINRMLIHARACPRDFLYQRITSPVSMTADEVKAAKKKDTSVKKSYSHRVPQGFTGLNSFVLPIGWFDNVSEITPYVKKDKGWEEMRLRYTRNMDTIVFEWEGKVFAEWLDTSHEALYPLVAKYNFIDVLYWR